MSALFYLANGLVLPPAMFFAYNFYKFKGNEIYFRRLWVSISLLSLTAIVTGLQYVFSEIISILDRNLDALLSGKICLIVGGWNAGFAARRKQPKNFRISAEN